MLNNVTAYLKAVKSLGWNTTWFVERFNQMATIGRNIEGSSRFLNRVKDSVVTPFGQFAVKEEAAGKLRVFALGDSISQSILSPLHSALFSLLKVLPNDGTFDQDASVKRCQDKATSSGKAFSFDLSAATDRLPGKLSAKILGDLFSPDLGRAWYQLLVNRDFAFANNTVTKYSGTNDVLRYAVGQPMGFLSSWPMLAITHH